MLAAEQIAGYAAKTLSEEATLLATRLPPMQ